MTESDVDIPCVVVGAGPVGLIAALAARMKGLDVLVVEAEPYGRPRPGSRAIGLWPWTLGRLQEVMPGLGERVAEAGIMVPGMEILYGGKKIFHTPVPALPRLLTGTSLPQTLTEQLWYDECVRLGVEFRWGAPVDDVDTDPDGATVTLRSGDRIRAAYVIGADGASSAVRKSLGISMSGHTDNLPFIIVDVAEHPNSSTPQTYARFHYRTPELDGRNVMWLPFRGGMRVDLQCRRGDDVDHLASAEGIREWMPKILDPWYADHVLWVSTYRFQQVVADDYTDPHGRVLLAGEAAHLFAPFGGGRGLNSGVIDATDAATAVAKAITAENRTAARAFIDECARDRRAAGRFNRDAAGEALRIMRGTDPASIVKRELARRIAPHFPLAGAWLGAVPLLGRMTLRPGASTIY